MKIAFYHELPMAPGVDIRAVLDGTAASSGGMGRIWLAVELAKLGHTVYVFHHAQCGSESEIIHNVINVRVSTTEEFVKRISSQQNLDFVVLNFYDDVLKLIGMMDGIRARRILWAGCNPPFEWCDFLDQERLHRMVCVSDICREPYRLHSNFRWVDYIYSSMNSSILVPSPALPVRDSVVFLGALREEKGFHHVLKAWPFVLKRRPNARLSVCGSIRLHFPDSPVGRTGVLSPEFEEKHLNSWIGAKGDWRDFGIEFLYPLSKEALFQHLGKTAVGIVNPNLTGSTETYCLSAVEMQTCGCPCVGGGVDGLLETIKDGYSGFHLKRQDPNLLAELVCKVLSDEKLREKLSLGALNYSKTFASSAREAEDWVRLFKNCISSTPCTAKKRVLIDCGRYLGAGRLKSYLKNLIKTRKNNAS